jgi:prepilin-type N-terminal cleavage/methylation domain-containing protein
MKSQGTNGFTLVELLVVIAIISILAGLLLPALDSALLQARLTACASNLRQVDLAFNLYYNDYNSFHPRPWNRGYENIFVNIWATTGTTKPAMGIGAFFEQGYLTDGAVALCPDNPTYGNSSIDAEATIAVLNNFADGGRWQSGDGPTAGSYSVTVANHLVTEYDGQAAHDWAGYINYYYRWGLADRLDGNLAGGQMWKHNTNSFAPQKLRSPLALVACGYPNMYRSYPEVHGKQGVNVLFANGIVSAYLPGPESDFMQSTLNPLGKVKNYLHPSYPDYEPPR